MDEQKIEQRAIEISKPGIYSEQHPSVYPRIRALRCSDFKWLENSQLQFETMRLRPELGEVETDSVARQRGRAYHAKALQSEWYPRLYCCEPDLEEFGRNKDGSASVKPRSTAMFRAEMDRLVAEGREILSAPEWHKVAIMVALAEADEEIGHRLASAREKELIIVWERDGLLCKAQIDTFGEDVGVPWIMDLKSTADVYGYFPREYQKWRVYRQVWWYSDGAVRSGLCSETPKFELGIIGNTPPHETLFGEIPASRDNPSRVLGERECLALFDRYAEGMRTGKWRQRFEGRVEATMRDTYFNTQMERLESGEF